MAHPYNSMPGVTVRAGFFGGLSLGDPNCAQGCRRGQMGRRR